MRQDVSRYFHIIYKLVKEVLPDSGRGASLQVKRLAEELLVDGYVKEAEMLNNALGSSSRIDLVPVKIGRSGVGFSGEELTRAVQLPVNKETGAYLVDVKFVDDLPDCSPLFAEPINRAILSMLQEWSNVEKLVRNGIEPVRSCLIYGVPGTGKTQLALWMAKQLGLPVVTARLDGLMSSYLGTTSKNIGSLFDFANRYKCLLLLDEFDAIAKFRADSQEIGEIKRVVNTLLQNMDLRKHNGFTIGITNHQALLDPAVWRRFDIQIEIPVPSKYVLEKIIIDKLEHVKLRTSQTKFLLWIIEGKTGAEADVLVTWIKKAKIVSGEAFDSMFYGLVQEFIFLNTGRVNSTHAKIVMQDDRSVLKEVLLDSAYKFNGTQISEILWLDKSTISRTKSSKRVAKNKRG